MLSAFALCSEGDNEQAVASPGPGTLTGCFGCCSEPVATSLGHQAGNLAHIQKAFFQEHPDFINVSCFQNILSFTKGVCVCGGEVFGGESLHQTVQTRSIHEAGGCVGLSIWAQKCSEEVNTLRKPQQRTVLPQKCHRLQVNLAGK